MRSVLTSHKTVLELLEEQLYDIFRTVLEAVLLTVLRSRAGSTSRTVLVEPAPLELSEQLALLVELFP